MDNIEPHAGARGWRSALLAVFAVSGFTGLIYESIWSHYLKLYLGHAAYAQTLVLCIFMGGMAIGAWGIGRLSERVARPLVVYAAVELVIGILALVFDRQFQWLVRWSFDTVFPGLASPFAVQLFKWSAASLLLLPQSVLLGATFPLISAGLLRVSPARSGETVALLYFANCMGAATGVLVSGFYLIGRFGLPGTLVVAGLLNVLVSLVAWLLARSSSQQSRRPVLPAGRSVSTRSAASVLAVAATVTGFVAFLYEIAWIRMLSLALGSSTHSFELMLAAFIFGLATGGLWIRRRIDGHPDPGGLLSRILLANAMMAALTVAGYRYSFDVIAWAKAAFAPTETGYVGFNIVSQTVAMAIMVPVTFFSGMTLPVITHLSITSGRGEGAVGRIYGLNTAGCIAGVLVAVHWLMPAAGLKATILTGALLTLGLAIAVGRSASMPVRRLPAPALTVCTFLVIGGIAVAITPDPRRMVSAVYRTGQARLPEDATIAYLRDGKTATISLARKGSQTVIATNGKPDASIQMGAGPPDGDEVTMILAAALPLAMHPSPSRVANIGIGSGLTSAVLLASPGVKELTSIEIEPFMVEAAELGFRPRTDRLYVDPRSRIVIEDAKTFFASHPSKYDVIVSEPSNPWVSGVATLFSNEFYRQLRQYLADDGLLVQWLQIYETDTDVVLSVVKALSRNFADYQLYNVDDADILVVASPRRSLGDPTAAIFDGKDMLDELARAGIGGVEDLTSRRIIDKALFDPYVWSTHVPMNSDYFPFVDQNAAKFRFMNRDALPIVELGMLPVPAIELANPRWPVAASPRPVANAQGHRSAMMQRAVLVANAFESGRFDALPSKVGLLVSSVDTTLADCSIPGRREVWMRALTELSAQTTPYLPYSELEPIWRRIQSSGCYRSVTPAENSWPDFLAAVARRDRDEIERIGMVLLAHVGEDSDPDDTGMLVTSVTAALYGNGKRAQAHALLARPPRPLRADPKYALVLQILFTASGTK